MSFFKSTDGKFRVTVHRVLGEETADYEARVQFAREQTERHNARTREERAREWRKLRK